MRKVVVTALVLVSMALPTLAQFKMPKTVYRMKELEKAQTEAREHGRPISFIYTQEKTTCPLCAGASLKAADELKKRTVVVYAECGTEENLLPAIVTTALHKPEAGNIIPQTVIVDSAMTNVLAIVPYGRGEEMDKLLKQASKGLPKTTVMRHTASNAPLVRTNAVFSIPIDENREVKVWQSRSGSKVKASLVQEIDTSVVLKKEDGAKVKISKYDLSKEDQDYIQDLRAKLSKKATVSDKQ